MAEEQKEELQIEKVLRKVVEGYYQIAMLIMDKQTALFTLAVAENVLLGRLYQLAKLLADAQGVSPNIAQVVREEYAKTLEVLATIYETRARMIRQNVELLKQTE